MENEKKEREFQVYGIRVLRQRIYYVLSCDVYLSCLWGHEAIMKQFFFSFIRYRACFGNGFSIEQCKVFFSGDLFTTFNAKKVSSLLCKLIFTK